ncbi:MAG TPA: leucyl/phenylalanyl-tRNA--protein transferase [Agitococcus sp.]|nr:leucyl/phenylalanyl-tRNA--protein transferase [Agitococcus sp.]HNA19909.1 leucyl/phenylalanyl-tRNA--protein transferase [Agitococcus sp.]HNB18982.1 leucyl/phenylalanyl-tRNA--protein transferase [Agitococcus sp.]HNC85513.1 leucyl/phenylalanyl-tRNA--protein transferase [Agitococcus sp.]HNG46142.1 leucyl/phenylalanyl-tRNA--protein transferase [Agitococcus sp.]
MPVFLPPHSQQFPDIRYADESGLLAYGGDLTPETLLLAYQSGVFPWYNESDVKSLLPWCNSPALWWSPDPRCVINPQLYQASHSLKKTLKSEKYSITVDRCFAEVIRRCAAPRTYANETWINQKIIASYSKLHQMGVAHSIETWNQQGELVGGLYGINLGKLFFGESMFSTATDASKVAFAFLMFICAKWQFPIVDCQLPNDHLLSLGAYTIPRTEFLSILTDYKDLEKPNWQALQNVVHSTKEITLV